MILPIKIYPDKHLRKYCEPVDTVDNDIRKLAADMDETRRHFKGIGLSAPQVGRLLRLIIAYEFTMVNPLITDRSKETLHGTEGCLSFPNHFENVDRPDWVRIRYTNLDNEEIEDTFYGLEAKCLQHEMDHLNGKLFIDYLTPLKRVKIVNAMIKKGRRL